MFIYTAKLIHQRGGQTKRLTTHETGVERASTRTRYKDGMTRVTHAVPDANVTMATEWWSHTVKRQTPVQLLSPTFLSLSLFQTLFFYRIAISISFKIKSVNMSSNFLFTIIKCENASLHYKGRAKNLHVHEILGWSIERRSLLMPRSARFPRRKSWRRSAGQVFCQSQWMTH